MDGSHPIRSQGNSHSQSPSIRASFDESILRDHHLSEPSPFFGLSVHGGIPDFESTTAGGPFSPGGPLGIRDPSLFATPSCQARLTGFATGTNDLLSPGPPAAHSIHILQPYPQADPSQTARNGTGRLPALSQEPLPVPIKSRRVRRTPEDKVAHILAELRRMHWTIGHLLYYLFRTHDQQNRPIQRSESHGSVVGNFLSGNTTHKAVEIVDFWLRDTAGRPRRDDPEYSSMYSFTAPYLTLKRARVALTSMCVQLCSKEMCREQKAAVRGPNGLHGSAAGRRGKELCWEDIGSKTVETVEGILKVQQPIALHLLTQLATPAPYKNETGVVVQRKSRPPGIVATEVLSTVNFSHTKFARLLPAARAILFFACGVQRVVFDYSSRTGQSQSWHATFNLLVRLAKQEAIALRQLGRDLLRWFIFRFDNVQQHHKQYERRIGRENSMKIGMAATVAEVFDFEPEAADLDDHLRRVEKNERKHLSVEKLIGMVDWEHSELVAELHWVQVLIDHVPCLSHLKPEMAELFRTVGAKLVVPVRKTKIYALPTVAKNEAVTTELRDGLVEFLRAVGQEEGDHTRRLIPVGGDGLSFEKLVQLKNLLSFHRDDTEDSEFQRLDMIWPFLEIWHTIWTYLSAVFETHFGGSLTRDPSTIGHSATQINQKAPPNLKKVDYYSSLYVAMVVLDARMLDCWRIHFNCDDIFTMFESRPQDSDHVMTVDELRAIARTLNQRYASQAAWTDAMEGGHAARDAGWTPGSRWDRDSERTQGSTASHGAARPAESSAGAIRTDLEDTEPNEAASDSDSGSEATQESHVSANASPPDRTQEPLFLGDRTLAQSILFMSDALVLRDISQAVREGDIGRVWNDMKTLMFRFSGSTHSKYCTYLLEMMCQLELESSPTLHEVFLRNWLVNPSGEPGRNVEGDLFQEHVNLELEEGISRKNAEWDSPYIRDVHAPNAIHFVELKNAWTTGVGLTERYGYHPEPHSRPEIRILHRTYREVELHRFREGRSYGNSTHARNMMARGIQKLYAGKLDAFISNSTRARAVRVTAQHSSPQDDLADSTEGATCDTVPASSPEPPSAQASLPGSFDALSDGEPEHTLLPIPPPAGLPHGVDFDDMLRQALEDTDSSQSGDGRSTLSLSDRESSGPSWCSGASARQRTSDSNGHDEGDSCIAGKSDNESSNGDLDEHWRVRPEELSAPYPDSEDSYTVAEDTYTDDMYLSGEELMDSDEDSSTIIKE
ncbi:hypothetical protein C8Q80DRAFT_1348203 [Daedaleopsis nitida]|nr:hypothetical protein C8Q80DRAFT_1348203 [Daedaleopsis nitida]